MRSFPTASTFDGLHRRSPKLSHPPPSLRSTATETKPANRKQPTASDFYVPSLPGQPKESQLIFYAGHLPFSPPDSTIPEDDDSYGFFFLNKARHIADRPILLLWLNGGPGCSSFDGSLMEVGPLRMVLKGAGALKEVDAAWNEYANMLFIDQPTGTGYSYGSQSNYLHELDASSSNLVNFLARFYQVFPEYQKMDIYICGESFAGQYIPYLAQAILDTNIITPPLKGIIIGNGWIDPINQYLAYPDFAMKTGLLTASSKAAELVEREAKKCNDSIKSFGDRIPIHIDECEGILNAITNSTVQTVNSQKMCLNIYDVRLVDTYPACGLTWPPDLADIAPYLSRSDVKAALHAEAHTKDWVECDARVNNNFWAHTSRPSIYLLPKLLDKIKVLLFAGDQDLICCHTGTERMIDNLNWRGHKGWTSEAKSLVWNVNGSFAGYWKEERNLTYVLVANASHMAPYDVPYATQDMLVRFLEIDAMSAAGRAAHITSRIGEEPGTTVNRVLLNETKLASTVPGGVNVGNTLGKSTTGSNITIKDEDYYNSSSAVIFLILVGLVVGLIFFVRNKLRKNGDGDFKSDDLHLERESMIKDDLNKDKNSVPFQRLPTNDFDELEQHSHHDNSFLPRPTYHQD